MRDKLVYTSTKIVIKQHYFCNINSLLTYCSMNLCKIIYEIDFSDINKTNC